MYDCPHCELELEQDEDGHLWCDDCERLYAVETRSTDDQRRWVVELVELCDGDDEGDDDEDGDDEGDDNG